MIENVDESQDLQERPLLPKLFVNGTALSSSQAINILVRTVYAFRSRMTTLFATDFFEIKAMKEIETILKKQLIISTVLTTIGIAMITWIALASSFTIFNFGTPEVVKNRGGLARMLLEIADCTYLMVRFLISSLHVWFPIKKCMVNLMLLCQSWLFRAEIRRCAAKYIYPFMLLRVRPFDWKCTFFFK
ncbi:hypothetical protein FNV43_RR02584 [Rhamnella rubrinervis]|uniref:H(+)-exporting diphosphatase n=1 Tax=Rhamnella rubrinervis TaxID=2594499 RepID=A0A8K0HT81_9ROSA|nr:hypothetical protein FNV43_RR02584 [Rhamnella rubrinervis]